MAHCTAASLGKAILDFLVSYPRKHSPKCNDLNLLVSENKVLCHPSSVDSLPTSAGQEDHVSMGGFAARKAIKVVENVEKG